MHPLHSNFNAGVRDLTWFCLFTTVLKILNAMQGNEDGDNAERWVMVPLVLLFSYLAKFLPPNAMQGNEDDDNAERRVKLYFLNTDGKWDDRGTGHVAIMRDETDYLMSMNSEEDKEEDGTAKAVFTTKISQDNVYQRQQGVPSHVLRQHRMMIIPLMIPPLALM